MAPKPRQSQVSELRLVNGNNSLAGARAGAAPPHVLAKIPANSGHARPVAFGSPHSRSHPKPGRGNRIRVVEPVRTWTPLRSSISGQKRDASSRGTVGRDVDLIELWSRTVPFWAWSVRAVMECGLARSGHPSIRALQRRPAAVGAREESKSGGAPSMLRPSEPSAKARPALPPHRDHSKRASGVPIGIVWWLFLCRCERRCRRVAARRGTSSRVVTATVTQHRVENAG